MPTLFTKISPGTARLHTLFHRHAGGVSFRSGGAVWRFGPKGRAGRTQGATLHGTLGDAEFTVWLNSPDWKNAAGSVLGVPAGAIDSMPDDLARAALECFAADALSALEQAAGVSVAVTGLTRADSEPLSSACPFELVADGGLRLAGSWSVASPAAEGLERLESLLRSRGAGTWALPDDFPVDAAVFVGMWTAPLSEVKELAAGDVALSPGGAERFVVIGSKWRCAACLTDGKLCVEGKTMTDAKEPPEAGGGAEETVVPLDGIDVDVQARVGRLTMTLGQIRLLGAGQIVEFSTPVESPVTLLANGRPVATGELVDVGGRVGVRIAAMAEEDGKAWED